MCLLFWCSPFGILYRRCKDVALRSEAENSRLLIWIKTVRTGSRQVPLRNCRQFKIEILLTAVLVFSLWYFFIGDKFSLRSEADYLNFWSGSKLFAHVVLRFYEIMVYHFCLWLYAILQAIQVRSKSVLFDDWGLNHRNNGLPHRADVCL